MSVTERVRAIEEAVREPLSALGLDVYDVHLGAAGRKSTVQVSVDRDGGVDLDALTTASEMVGYVLEAAELMTGPYSLEVTSPGLERPLRRPEHFRRAVGEQVLVRWRDSEGRAERMRGTLVEAGDEGFTVEVDGERRRARYDATEQARTVFEWGPTPKPGARDRSRR